MKSGMVTLADGTVKRAEDVTAADCVAQMLAALKDMNPYQKELYFQRVERALAVKDKPRWTTLDGKVYSLVPREGIESPA
jgi:hypothetical protein